MSDLLPCPFCGGAARAFKRTCDKNTPYDPAHRAFPIVRCGACGACSEGDDWTGRQTAIDKWNRRALPAITPESGNQATQGASAITSKSAQSVPLLSDEEVDSVWDAIPQTQFWWRRYARAIEQAVRAKQAPLPAEQIQKLRHLIDWTDSESYLTFARAIEAAHGIVGKEGA